MRIVLTVNKYFETTADFWRFVDGTYATQKGSKDQWRYGQTAFNVLAAYRPDLSERVRGTTLDPFYCEKGHLTVQAFADFVEENW